MIPRFSSAPRPSDFFSGFALPFRALGLLMKTQKLRRLALLASAVTFVALFAVVWLLGGHADDLIGYFWTKPHAWYGQALWYLAVVATFLLLVVVGANTVPLLLLAPLQDPLSEAAEEALGGFQAKPFSLGTLAAGVAVSIGHTFARIALLLGGHLLLLPLHLVPGYGSLIWTFAASAWTVWWIAGEYLSGPMARHLYSFGDVRRALWARKGLSFGFGTAVYFLLWVPVLNLFFIPLATVAGTLLFRGLLAAGQIPPKR